MPIEHSAARASAKLVGNGPYDGVAKCRERIRHVTLRSLDIGEGRNLGVMQPLLFSAGIWMAVGKALECQETVGGDAQGGMVMEAAPTATFVMRHAELLL